MRIRFLSPWNDSIEFKRGGQRAFLDLMILKLRVSSLRGLLQFGFNVPYSTLKNYYIEARLMPENLVRDFCEVSGVDFEELEVEEVEENWGKVLGGKVGKGK